MTREEQITICKILARTCAWGSSAYAESVVKELQHSLPLPDGWLEVYQQHLQESIYEAVGVVKDEARVRWFMGEGYYFCNYKPGELQIHFPRHCGGGLSKYVLGDLADKIAAELHL